MDNRNVNVNVLTNTQTFESRSICMHLHICMYLECESAFGVSVPAGFHIQCVAFAFRSG